MSLNISITNDDLKLAIRKIIKDQNNKEDFIQLIHDLLSESHTGSAYFIKLALGGSLPLIPNIGDQGYVNIDSLGYGQDKDAYRNSEFCQHGFIPCTVNRIKSIASYCPLFVILPDINQIERETSITIEQFYLDASADPYD